MRLPILFLSLAIVAAATVGPIPATESPAQPTSPAVSARGSDPWRRTAKGWERTLVVARPLKTPRAGMLHPGVVASLQILVSFGSLIYFSAGNPQSDKSLLTRPVP